MVKNAKIFNSRRADFAPMYLDKNFDQLFFTSTNEKNMGEHKSEITGMKKATYTSAKRTNRGNGNALSLWRESSTPTWTRA